jgi:hypothetical protein
VKHAENIVLVVGRVRESWLYPMFLPVSTAFNDARSQQYSGVHPTFWPVPAQGGGSVRGESSSQRRCSALELRELGLHTGGSRFAHESHFMNEVARDQRLDRDVALELAISRPQLAQVGPVPCGDDLQTFTGSGTSTRSPSLCIRA